MSKVNFYSELVSNPFRITIVLINKIYPKLKELSSFKLIDLQKQSLEMVKFPYANPFTES